jgi:hypothetical protein
LNGEKRGREKGLITKNAEGAKKWNHGWHGYHGWEIAAKLEAFARESTTTTKLEA